MLMSITNYSSIRKLYEPCFLMNFQFLFQQPQLPVSRRIREKVRGRSDSHAFATWTRRHRRLRSAAVALAFVQNELGFLNMSNGHSGDTASPFKLLYPNKKTKIYLFISCYLCRFIRTCFLSLFVANSVNVYNILLQFY